MAITINRKVLDLSHWNVIPSMEDFDAIKAAGIVGIIHKATEGTYFKDDKYANRKAAFVERGFKWAAYHWFNQTASIENQLQFFLGYTGIDSNMFYAMDWEDDPKGTASEAQAEAFMRALERETGVKQVVYSGNTAKERITTPNAYLGSCRLWLADYRSEPTWDSSWAKPWLWQYSDGKVGPTPRGCPGVQGQVDTNHWSGTDDELKRQWSGRAPPVGVPKIMLTVDASEPVIVTIVRGSNVTVETQAPTPPVASDIQQNIIATVFGGNNSKGAYGDPLTPTGFYVALPWRIEGERRNVKVTNVATGAPAIAVNADVGPWMIDDNYEASNSRPVAEECFNKKLPLPRGPNAGTIPTNAAGIDLSPALAAAIGISGKGAVNWEFV